MTELTSNYPSPFNPVTSIQYSLHEDGYVLLKVYDFLGKEVATLVDGVETAGFKSVEFTANELPSGLYFYRLSAGSFMDTKRMLLVR